MSIRPKIDNDEIEKIIREKWWLGKDWRIANLRVSIDVIDSENLTLSILGIK